MNLYDRPVICGEGGRPVDVPPRYDLYGKVDWVRKQDPAAFDRTVARVFGPPDYTEHPELKGYFNAEGVPLEDLKKEFAAVQALLAREQEAHARATQHVQRITKSFDEERGRRELAELNVKRLAAAAQDAKNRPAGLNLPLRIGIDDSYEVTLPSGRVVRFKVPVTPLFTDFGPSILHGLAAAIERDVREQVRHEALANAKVAFEQRARAHSDGAWLVRDSSIVNQAAIFA